MLCTALLPFALAQNPDLKTWEFGEPESLYGAALCAVGDWDADGVEDYAVGAPGADVQAGFFTYERHGRVEVRSGATGEVIAATANLYPSDDVGLGTELVGGFDSDQDGLPELAATAGTLQEVTVLERLSPTSSALVRIADIEPISTSSLVEQDFGATLANVGDLTGDGIADLAIGSPFSDELFGGVTTAENAGAVRLVSGATWSTVVTYTFGDEDARFGAAIATVGDMNGGGSPRELAVGAPGRTNSTNNTAGRVHFIDPQLLAPVANFDTLVAPSVGTGLGAGLLELGNVSGGPGSELVVGSVVAATTIDALAYVEGLVYETIESGSVALYDLDTLTALWVRGGAGVLRYDGRSLAAGNLDGDAADEIVTVSTRTPTAPARLQALNAVTGLAEHTFGGASALSLFPGVPTIVGPDVSGDGRSDVLMGSSRLEFRAGGTFGYVVVDGPPGPAQPKTSTVGPGQDFEGLSQAAMVAGPRDTLLVEPGAYGYTALDQRVTVVGPTAGSAFVQGIEVKGVDAGRLERIAAGVTTLAGISGRMTLEGHSALVLDVLDCPDVTVLHSSIGPGSPGVRVEDSRVELVDCDVEGEPGLPIAGEGQPALDLFGGASVLAADSRLLGPGPGVAGPFGSAAPGPAVILRTGSRLDLRGGPNALVQGGTDPQSPSNDAADVVSLAASPIDAAVDVSSGFPPLTVVGFAAVFYDTLLRPWIEYPSSAELGLSWTVDAFAEPATPGLLYVSLAPLDLLLPQLSGIPLQIDPTQAIDIRPFVGGGASTPSTTLYPTPSNPAFSGLEVHVQALVQRPPGLIDATNGGAVQLRP